MNYYYNPHLLPNRYNFHKFHSHKNKKIAQNKNSIITSPTESGKFVHNPLLSSPQLQQPKFPIIPLFTLLLCPVHVLPIGSRNYCAYVNALYCAP